ncbi:ribonuclease HII [Aestuariimicrobium sp. p3-SID1156]|uniref:ribonuclease HII n=1 Tax=Aestuariimicrobium sp. p3-SID1156 TaxID=2916038 RepID=UPI00223BBC4C|nr:ribonuclease HII [Aestuariimicrobium sp. p3-SID1156]MCT1460304.1 ribonuclease HII [Aestuariimicrobium sp. p3-SID1156]
MSVRPGRGIYGYERALVRAGLGPVAGADEAGRGACAGPLVAAAVVLGDTPSRRITGLNDSKVLTALQRERCFEEIMAKAVDVAWVAVEAEECDRLGMHVADLQALRRALMRLQTMPGFILTDGFSVDGLPAPGLAVWKGDRVAACVAAASVVAKVTRDRMMAEHAITWPDYGFEVHKGYCTAEHQARLEEHGPSPIHRMRFENVRLAARVNAP